MNPLKQSYGARTAEFLRLAMSKDKAFGYLARTISSTVSGNWVAERRLSPEEAMSTMQGAAWTLRNRSGTCFAELLLRDVMRVTHMSRKSAKAVLTHKVSVCGSPIHAVFKTGFSAELFIEKAEDDGLNEGLAAIEKNGGLGLATKDYLTNCLNPAELFVVQKEGVSVERTMVWSSYKKTLIDELKTHDTTLTLGEYRIVNPAVRATEVTTFRRENREIAPSPILELLKNRLSAKDIAIIGQLLGYEGTLTREVIFPDSAGKPFFCESGVTYADARYTGGRITGEIIYANYPIYM
jgi:hypothetical protein